MYWSLIADPLALSLLSRSSSKLFSWPRDWAADGSLHWCVSCSFYRRLRPKHALQFSLSTNLLYVITCTKPHPGHSSYLAAQHVVRTCAATVSTSSFPQRLASSTRQHGQRWIHIFLYEERTHFISTSSRQHLRQAHAPVHHARTGGHVARLQRSLALNVDVTWVTRGVLVKVSGEERRANHIQDGASKIQWKTGVDKLIDFLDGFITFVVVVDDDDDAVDKQSVLWLCRYQNLDLCDIHGWDCAIIGHSYDDVIWLQIPECYEASYCICYIFFSEESLVHETNLHYKGCSEMHSGSCSQMTSSCRCPIRC